VTLRGEDITNLPAHKLVERGVGYVPQTNNVFPSLTIEENLEMGLYLAPKRSRSASSSSPTCSRCSPTAQAAGRRRCPAASGRWSRWAGR
jgi:ABC-type branched-subunit amino acid transport system ATPase component